MAASPFYLAGGILSVSLIIAGVIQSRIEQRERIPDPPTQTAATQAPLSPPVTAPQAPADPAPQRRVAAPPPPPELQQAQRRYGSVELKAGTDGHFVAPVDINGRQFKMLVDTGATMLTLSYEDARKAAINVSPADFRHPVSTAGGAMKAARVKVSRVGVGPLMVRDLEALVLPAGTGTSSLLGMNYLRSLSSYEVKADRMIMRN